MGKQRQDAGHDDALAMPPCDAYHLVAYLFEIGPTVVNGMGEAPITQGDIAHFQSNTGIALDAWQARTLRRMSLVYLSASYKAKKQDCLAPWQEADYAVSPSKHKANKMRASIRALAAL